MFDNGGMEYFCTAYGQRARVHREYVDVIARFGRDGSLEPVVVQWKDGRSFPVDEILQAEALGAPERGCRTARYDVRFGRHETSLYLEQRDAEPALQTSARLRWWVWARDMVKSRPAQESTDSVVSDSEREPA